jgi:hypothetical protein
MSALLDGAAPADENNIFAKIIRGEIRTFCCAHSLPRCLCRTGVRPSADDDLAASYKIFETEESIGRDD